MKYTEHRKSAQNPEKDKKTVTMQTIIIWLSISRHIVVKFHRSIQKSIFLVRIEFKRCILQSRSSFAPKYVQGIKVKKKQKIYITRRKPQFHVALTNNTMIEMKGENEKINKRWRARGSCMYISFQIMLNVIGLWVLHHFSTCEINIHSILFPHHNILYKST